MPCALLKITITKLLPHRIYRKHFWISFLDKSDAILDNLIIALRKLFLFFHEARGFIMNFFMRLTLASTLIFTNTVIAHEMMDEPTSQVNISIEGNYRYITSNGIPTNHGKFPNPGNPNTISAQLYQFRVPLFPLMTQQIIAVTRDKNTGVALNGIPFDPLSAEFWENGHQTRGPSSSSLNSWNYEAMHDTKQLGLDHNNAHVQPNGAYHYHGLPKALYKKLSDGKTPPDKMILLGYAADGFPMYGLYGYSNDSSSSLKLLIPSFQLKTGARPQGAPSGNYDGTFVEDYEYVAGSGDLDQCNGRYGVTPEYPKGIYYYAITNTYPYLPRCFRGTPDPSFSKDREHPIIANDGRKNELLNDFRNEYPHY